MFISKFWTLLLALIAGTMLAVILLAKDVVNRERVESATAVLYKEMTKTDVALKLHARSRIDVLLSVSVDPAVRRMLAVASSGPDKAVKIRDNLLGVLRKRNQDLGKYKADMLIAIDLKGDVVVQVGKNERQHGHRLAGFPVVDAALRGYLRDDIWKIVNEIHLIAARPVIEQGRYVGAIVHAVKVSDKLASEISPSVQLAFFAGNTMVAVGTAKESGAPKAQGAIIAKPLDKVIKSSDFKTKGYSDIQRIDAPDGEFLAVYTRVRGEAAHNDVGFALITPITTMTSAADFYEKAGSQDVEKLPLIAIIIGVLLVFGLSWVWNYLEAQRPMNKLHAAITVLEKSDPKDQLNIYNFRRKVRKIAGSINALMDYKMKGMLESSNGNQSRSIDSILGKEDDVRLSSASFKFLEPSADDVPDAPPVDGPKKDEPRPSPEPPPPSSPGKPPAPPATGPQKPPPAPPATGPQTPPEAPPETAAGVEELSPEEEQAYFKEIYNEFIKLKSSLGESTEQLTFERFLVTLKKNRDTLKARYDCKRVKFKVYEKGGKASLKATPVKA